MFFLRVIIALEVVFFSVCVFSKSSFKAPFASLSNVPAVCFQGILNDGQSRHKPWNKLNQRSREPYLRMQPWLNGDQGQNAHVQQAPNQGEGEPHVRPHPPTDRAMRFLRARLALAASRYRQSVTHLLPRRPPPILPFFSFFSLPPSPSVLGAVAVSASKLLVCHVIDKLVLRRQMAAPCVCACVRAWRARSLPCVCVCVSLSFSLGV